VRPWLNVVDVARFAATLQAELSSEAIGPRWRAAAEDLDPLGTQAAPPCCASATRSTGTTFASAPGGWGIDAIATPIHAKGQRGRRTSDRHPAPRVPRPSHVLDEWHLRSVLTEFVQYYNQERPHRTLGPQTPEARPRLMTGAILLRPLLNGLHHVYERAA
jgi:hypothetical protein